MKIIPFERDDASNNSWNFPYEFPSFYLTRWITINFHAKTSHRAARATIQGCELNYFPPDEAYSSSASVAEEQKRHPFWFLLLRSSASNKLYIPIELQWHIVATIHRLILFPPSLLFLTQCVYEVHSRGWIAARFNSDFGKRSSILFGLTSFFSPLLLSCICR